jgi:hypothetical protein
MGRGNGGGGGMNFANDGFGMEGGMGFSGGGDYLVKMRGLPFSATPADIADVSLCQLSLFSVNTAGCFLILLILLVYGFVLDNFARSGLKLSLVMLVLDPFWPFSCCENVDTCLFWGLLFHFQPPVLF